jgi:DNA-binding transcriptional ArsR family regulator
MATAARRDVFQAIADPTRRQIITLVSREAMNLNAIADNFDSSRSAISQHIKILAECGLIMINQQGRERFCEAKLESLSEVSSWIDMSKKLWTSRFDRMENLLNELQTKRNSPSKNKSKQLKSKK